MSDLELPGMWETADLSGGWADTQEEIKNCLICGRSQSDRPAIFRNEPYCSDRCRKVLGK